MLKRFGIAAAAGAVALGLAEAALWLFPPKPFLFALNSESLLRPDPLLGTALRPNLDLELLDEEGRPFRVRTDSRGFRALPDDGRKERRNILALGDSFLFGSGVSDTETFAARLHQMLDDRFPGKLRVVNAGVPGYATNQELVFYLERGHEWFKPSLVLVFFYMNDVALGGLPEDQTHYYPYRIPVPLPKAAANRAPTGPRLPLFLRWLRHRAEESRKEKEIKTETNLRTIRGTEPSMYYKPFRASQREVLELNVRRMFAMMDLEVRARGSRLMVVLLPSPLEAEEGNARQNYYKNYTPDRDAWDWTWVNSEIERIFNETNISYVNLAPVFRRHWEMTNRTLYFNGDGHFTAEGHAVAARAVYPALEAAFRMY